MRRELPWVLYVFVLVVAFVPAIYVQSEDFSAAFGGLFLASLALGLAVGRPLVAAAALFACIVCVIVSDYGLYWWLLLLSTLPWAVGLALAGWGLARVLRHRAFAGSLVAFALALVVAAPGVADAVRHSTAEHVPLAVQRQLPLEYSLGNLCPDAETPRELRRRIRREADVLLRELARRPGALVPYTYEYEEGDVKKDITIRTLAEDRLEDLTFNPRCAPKLRQRLEDALRPE